MAYTEFYCNASTGSNMNGGSDAGGAAIYTSTNGNWSTVTNIFTPTDGTNPVSAGVTVGQFAGIYLDGATTPVFLARVTAVSNATNGTITVSSSARAGTAPTTGATGRTIKVGGTWKGPNAGNVTFPFSLSGTALSNATDASAHPVRVNFKNNSTYSISTGIAPNGFVDRITFQGYSSSAGDGGRAIIDGSTNAITLFSNTANQAVFRDLIFSSSASSGAVNNIVEGGQGNTYIGVVSHGARVSGFATTSTNPALFIECEAYACNTSNTTDRGGFDAFSGASPVFVRCLSHDNTGNASSGFTTRIKATFLSCIAWGNGKYGFIGVSGLAGDVYPFLNCDAYNNTSDGLASVLDATFLIENCNFIKNGGKGINITNSSSTGFVLNCGYGAGTQANSGGDAALSGNVQEIGKVTYANDVTPWVAPSTGNFSINLAAAQGVGRGAFTETDGTNTGTVGYPDIGAAQAQVAAPQKSYTFGG